MDVVGRSTFRRWRAVASSPASWAIAGYSACSVTMVLVNKAIAMLPACRLYDLALLPVVLQNAFALGLLVAWEACLAAREPSKAGRGAGLAARVAGRLWPGWARFFRCMPCALAFTAMILTGFLALGGVAVPFLTVGKNAANVVTALGEYMLLGFRPGWSKAFALGFMLIAALAAAWHDLAFTAGPYGWLALNCGVTSVYVLMMRILSLGGKDLPGREASIAINNAVSLALLLPAACLRGEPQRLWRGVEDGSQALVSPEALFLHALAGVCAFLLNFATMRCVGLTSATTYAMVGAANKLPIALLGFAIWRVPVSREGAVSVAIGLTSAFIYALQ